MSHEIPGDEKCTMYHLHFAGGPKDGQVVNSFRPYDKMREPDGSVYGATEEGESCPEWVDDWTKKIVLHYQPDGVFP